MHGQLELSALSLVATVFTSLLELSSLSDMLQWQLIVDQDKAKNTKVTCDFEAI